MTPRSPRRFPVRSRAAEVYAYMTRIGWLGIDLTQV